MKFKSVVYNNVKTRLYEEGNETFVAIRDMVTFCDNTSLQVYAPKIQGYKTITSADVDGAGMYGNTTKLGVLSLSGIADMVLNRPLREKTKAELRKFVSFLHQPSTPPVTTPLIHQPIPTTPTMVKQVDAQREEIQALKEEIQNLREENRVVKEMYNKAMEQKMYTTPDIIKAVEDKLHKAEADVVKYRSILEELRCMQWDG